MFRIEVGEWTNYNRFEPVKCETAKNWISSRHRSTRKRRGLIPTLLQRGLLHGNGLVVDGERVLGQLEAALFGFGALLHAAGQLPLAGDFLSLVLVVDLPPEIFVIVHATVVQNRPGFLRVRVLVQQDVRVLVQWVIHSHRDPGRRGRTDPSGRLPNSYET